MQRQHIAFSGRSAQHHGLRQCRAALLRVVAAEIHRFAHVGDRIGQRLSGLPYAKRDQVLDVRFKALREPIEHGSTRIDARVGPGERAPWARATAARATAAVASTTSPMLVSGLAGEKTWRARPARAWRPTAARPSRDPGCAPSKQRTRQACLGWARSNPLATRLSGMCTSVGSGNAGADSGLVRSQSRL